MRPCYFCRVPPDVEISEDHIIIKPAYTVEIDFVVTPHTLQKIVAKYNRALDEWHERQGAKVIRIASPGPRSVG